MQNGFTWPAQQVDYMDVEHKFVPYEFVGTNQNSFSWPAQQVSYMDVANNLVPDQFVLAVEEE